MAEKSSKLPTRRGGPRSVGPFVPQQQQQQVQRVIHTANRMSLNNGQQFYVIQQQDGQQILIAAPQQQQQIQSLPQSHVTQIPTSSSISNNGILQ